MVQSPASKTSIYAAMLRGSTWALALRWSVRFIGFISVVILARLLRPEDFGIVAMGALTIGFIGTFSELGVQMLLIRTQDAGKEECDTAWTLKILQGVFIGVVLVLFAPFAADYFNDERVVNVVYVLACGAVLDGAQNIGMVLARKELDFARDFRFNLYVRIAGFVFTVGLALLLRSYWALVFGRILASLFSLPLSFLMHPYRPRLSLARARSYLKFSTSIVPLRFGRFLNGKVDVLYVGRLAGTTQLGVYNVAGDLAAMFTQEILQPLGRGLMPSYAKLNHDPKKLAAAFGHVLRISAVVVFPLGIALSVLAGDIVRLVLGSQWVDAIPLLKILAWYSMLSALIHLMSNQILIVSGYERRSAILMWVRIAILVPLIVFAGGEWGVEGIAWGRLATVLLALPISIIVLTRSIPFGVGEVIKAFWRPLIAALAMGWVLNWATGELDFGLFARFILELGLGVVAYVLCLSALWVLSGRPAGAEKLAVDFMTNRK